MSALKNLVRSLLRRAGFELLHRSDDPVLAQLRAAHESLRLSPNDRVRWDDTLPRAACDAHLRNLLHLHAIDLVLDIGANRGQFARSLRHLGYTGDIVSFEPLSRHRAELQQAADADGRWKLYPLALGDALGEAELRVYQDDSFSSLHAVNRAGHDRFSSLVATEHVERVPVRTLDSLWPEISAGRPRRAFLKTDTQGHDLAVLSGSTSVLQSTLALLVEAPFQPIYENAASFAELSAWLAARGFTPSGLFPISHRLEDLALIEVDACFTRATAIA